MLLLLALAARTSLERQPGGSLFQPLLSSNCSSVTSYNGSNPSEGDLNPIFPCVRLHPSNDGLQIVASNIPDHQIWADNPYEICHVSYKVTLPSPKLGTANLPVPQLGPIGIATNGVFLFGPKEGDDGNAVSGSGGIRVACDGHPQREGIWHYHHPQIGCRDHDEETLVGYALDGFPIYGPLKGTKEDAGVLNLQIRLLGSFFGSVFNDLSFNLETRNSTNAVAVS
eukprot:Plantae.Rhodophyta-Rhodochaete_pulchella.ctg26184.p1 GENE.Plantae.Rhodophyta-Rhodochaete_pulchella.ctg26184~~Plantae.Rhodophyta-Rhodochaete_pulchella.ctg26184.p1  ORF type:complete len:226 (-),score=14.30 Plantae.Rhodophyta-Rhodochaete_pulchella.ctg26184:397-1074(-)